MKKLFAMFLALTMTFQLITPVWADGAGEEPEEATEASEVAGEATTETTEEELPEETAEAPTESEEVPTEKTVPETTEAEETVEETVGMLAEDVIDSGTCGDDLTWVLTQDGTLTISGSGGNGVLPRR